MAAECDHIFLGAVGAWPWEPKAWFRFGSSSVLKPNTKLIHLFPPEEGYLVYPQHPPRGMREGEQQLREVATHLKAMCTQPQTEHCQLPYPN